MSAAAKPSIATATIAASNAKAGTSAAPPTSTASVQRAKTKRIVTHGNDGAKRRLRARAELRVVTELRQSGARARGERELEVARDDAGTQAKLRELEVDDRFERGKQCLLGIEPLDDRFDHDRASRKAPELIGQGDPCNRRIGAARGDPAFGGEGCEHVRDRTLGIGGRTGLGIDQAHVETRLRGNLRDAASHQTRADDADAFVARTGCLHC